MDDSLTGKILGAAIEVHRILGPGLLEAIYEDALFHEFLLRGIACERQKEIPVVYKGRQLRPQKVDLLVESEVIVELKAVSLLPDVATAQVLSYLRASELRLALLINFGERRLIDGVKRIIL